MVLSHWSAFEGENGSLGVGKGDDGEVRVSLLLAFEQVVRRGPFQFVACGW